MASADSTPFEAAPMEQAPSGEVRPLVGRKVSNRGVWLFGIALAVSAGALFAALESRRATVTSPATAIPQAASGGMIAAAPPLDLGGASAMLNGVPLAPELPAPHLASGLFAPPRGPVGLAGPRGVGTFPIPTAPPVRSVPYLTTDSPDPPYLPPQPGIAPSLPEAAPAANAVAGQLAGGRVGATRFANPANTVPQGSVVLAVLETALDSNRPGFVRAVVSRDVRSFDGSRVLIPRGSRLFGEYKADLAQGQNRAFVQWQKLTRPDGVQIALDSPAADPLGRSGVGGKVNTHFFQRFAGAIMQSALDIGVGVATRSATGGNVVVGLPGSTQTMINPQADAIKPTLSVRNGTSVSVFVARDLDFSAVE